MTQKSSSIRGKYHLKIYPYTPACKCPVCDGLLKDDVDMQNFFFRGACSDCVDTYYYPNADLWDEGWRPEL